MLIQLIVYSLLGSLNYSNQEHYVTQQPKTVTQPHATINTIKVSKTKIRKITPTILNKRKWHSLPIEKIWVKLLSLSSIAFVLSPNTHLWRSINILVENNNQGEEDMWYLQRRKRNLNIQQLIKWQQLCINLNQKWFPKSLLGWCSAPWYQCSYLHLTPSLDPCN